MDTLPLRLLSFDVPIVRGLVLVACLSFGGCNPETADSLESRFERDRPKLSVAEGPTSEPSCGGTSLDVYRDGNEVRLLDWIVEASIDSMQRKYYLSGDKPKLVIETVHRKYDASGEPLSNPRLLSTRRVDLTSGTSQDQRDLIEHAEFLLEESRKLPAK